jgi:hypothetical protein
MYVGVRHVQRGELIRDDPEEFQLSRSPLTELASLFPLFLWLFVPQIFTAMAQWKEQQVVDYLVSQPGASASASPSAHRSPSETEKGTGDGEQPLKKRMLSRASKACQQCRV